MRQSRIRVLCVDDHQIVLEGLALIINREPDMQVVGSAVTGEEAIALFDRCHPDVTLMDLRLRSMGGVEAIRAIRRKDLNARIVVLTIYQGDEDIHRALDAGATTYLLKDTLSDDLLKVIRQVYEGKPSMNSPDVTARLEERAAGTSLTAREVQVMELMFRGMRNKEIAASLGISSQTARVHVRNIFKKLKVQDRTEAVNVGLRRGIIHAE